MQSHSTGIRNLDGDAYKAIKIAFPSLPEQQRIVGILDEAFDGIATAKANAEKNLKNARALFESHLQSVFTRRGEGWVDKTLEEVADANCTLSYGIVQPGDEYLDGLPVVRPTDLTTKVIRLSGLKRIDPKLAGGYKRTALHGGELLLCVRGSTGVVSIASTELVGANVTRGIVPIRFDRSLLTPDFGFYLISSGPVQSQIREKTYGAALMQINIRDLRNVTLSFPALNEQKVISAKLNELHEETQHLESIYQRKLSALDALKKSLLHQAFTGNLTEQSRQSVVIPFPTKIPNITTTDLHAGILAIAYQLHENKGKAKHFGHVKAEKIAHLIESHVGIDLGRTPIKDAAGPNDYPHLMRVEHRAKKADYFDFQRVKNAGYRVAKYRQFEGLIERTRERLEDRSRDVDSMIELMLPMDTQQAEIFCTVYAAWNNLLLGGQQPTDESIVIEARENWHPDKLNIPREKFFTAISWMKKKGVIPKGEGKKVSSKAKKKK